MIDNLSILLSHALLAYAFWVLVNRPDLDSEAPPAPDPKPDGFAKKSHLKNSHSNKRSDAPNA
jgi:hypothetical protein